MKRIQIFLILMLCLFFGVAQAETLPESILELLPADAVVIGEQDIGTLRVTSLSLPTGEQLELTWDERVGEPLSLVTQVPAEAENAGAPSREEAEAVLRNAVPGAGVLFSEDGPDNEKILYLLSGRLCGKITVRSGIILSRDLACGSYMLDGRLTMDGALAALKLHRPEAEFRALELDEDDGILIYEGNALVNGAEYEFELNARTGRLIEWERD